jgi:hypothetical protein
MLMAFFDDKSGQLFDFVEIIDTQLSNPTKTNFVAYHGHYGNILSEDLFVMFTYLLANWTDYGGETAREKMLTARQSSLQVCDSLPVIHRVRHFCYAQRKSEKS